MAWTPEEKVALDAAQASMRDVIKDLDEFVAGLEARPEPTPLQGVQHRKGWLVFSVACSVVALAVATYLAFLV